jgi:transcriptional regulator with XRE-family HTH domain
MASIDGRYELLGAILQAIRNKRGLTQAQLAQLLGYRQAFISKLELGLRPLTVTQLIDISAKLSIDPTEVMRQLVTTSAPTHKKPAKKAVVTAKRLKPQPRE